MIIVLNGPLGIGKSTLAESLAESIDQCVMLDGDHLVAVNPPFPNELEHLHSTIALLIEHHRSFGYRHFILNHAWMSATELADLCTRLADIDTEVRCFRLVLSVDENLRRIERRANARALDERQFEYHTFSREYETFNRSSGSDLGEPFDASAAPLELVKTMLDRLDLSHSNGDSD